MTHGCTSGRLILPDENTAEWETVLQEWLDDYEPHIPTFGELVRLAAEAAWFLRRNTRRYNEAEQRLAEQQSNAFLWTEEQHRLLERFLRYKTAAERVFYRARNAAEQARKARITEEAQMRRLAIQESEAEKKSDEAEEAADEEEEDAEASKASLMLQHGSVTVNEGMTRTYVTISNDQLIEWIDKKRGQGKLPIIIHRDLQFDCDEIPPEYEWVKELMEKARLTFKPGKVMNFEPISDEEFLRIAEQQRLARSDHWLE